MTRQVSPASCRLPLARSASGWWLTKHRTCRLAGAVGAIWAKAGRPIEVTWKKSSGCSSLLCRRAAALVSGAANRFSRMVQPLTPYPAPTGTSFSDAFQSRLLMKSGLRGASTRVAWPAPGRISSESAFSAAKDCFTNSSVVIRVMPPPSERSAVRSVFTAGGMSRPLPRRFLLTGTATTECRNG